MSGGGFLAAMAAASAARAKAARAHESEAALRSRAAVTAPPPGLRLDPSGFDLIAEFKRRAPSLDSASVAAAGGDGGGIGGVSGPLAAAARARLYAAGGAAAISVLTEPERFGGQLCDLASVAEAVTIPAMRKDFLVDPYQVFEARAAGAGGVLCIMRLLDDARLRELLDAARESGLFVLLEAFDRGDLERAAALVTAAAPTDPGNRLRLLIGVNTRDLADLAVDRGRLAALCPHLPAGVPPVAESGLAAPDDAATAARLGYRLALVGGALMRSPDPATRARDLLAAGRAAAQAARAARVAEGASR